MNEEHDQPTVNLLSIVDTQLSSLVSCISEDDFDRFQAEIISLCERNGPESHVMLLKKLIRTCYSHMRSENTDLVQRLLVQEIQRMGRDPFLADRLMDTLECEEDEIFQNLELQTLFNQASLYPLERLVLASALVRSTRSDFASVAAQIVHESFDNALLALATYPSFGRVDISLRQAIKLLANLMSPSAPVLNFKERITLLTTAQAKYGPELMLALRTTSPPISPPPMTLLGQDPDAGLSGLDSNTNEKLSDSVSASSEARRAHKDSRTDVQTSEKELAYKTEEQMSARRERTSVLKYQISDRSEKASRKDKGDPGDISMRENPIYRDELGRPGLSGNPFSPQGAIDVDMLDEMHSPRSTTSVLSNQMSCEEMFQHLVDHGCADLSLHMDPDQYSSGLIVGGGFGDIWKGKLRDGVEVAIKVWRFSSLSLNGPKSMKRAMREIYHWSKAKHEYVQELMGVILFQGRLGMVSRWMDHGNMREYIQKCPGANRYSLCLQAAEGLAYLHSQGMVHGDLKAANILVSRDGTAKLSDFDHSIMSECSLVFSETSKLGGGTTRWMAPELIFSTDTCRNTLTDVYALGMTILEIITGNPPYYPQCREETHVILALMRQILPDRPMEYFGDNARDNQMWDLLLSCWDRDPAVRPRATDVVDVLQSIIPWRT